MAKHFKGNASDKLAMAMIYLFFFVIVLLIILAFLTIITRSLSSRLAILSGESGLLPDIRDIHLDSYKLVLQDSSFLSALLLTVGVTMFGTAAAMATTVGAAYALSKKDLRGKKALMILFVFAWIFSGGLMPTYVTLSKLHLVNTVHILWTAGVLDIALMLVLKTWFESIPREFGEAAAIDGAGQLSILWKVYVPLSGPILSVIAFYYAIGYWNNYYTSMVYTSKTSLRTLQVVLKDIIFSSGNEFQKMMEVNTGDMVTASSVASAGIVITVIPILILFLFVQKHIRDGVMSGAIKE